VSETDDGLAENVSSGQDVIDALTSLRMVAPSLDVSLHPRLITLFPSVILALQSRFSLIRTTAAKCIAALCDVMTEEGMKRMVDDVVPLIGDATRVEARQGAIEAVHRKFVSDTKADRRYHQDPRDQGVTLCPLLNRPHSWTNVGSRRASPFTVHIHLRGTGQNGTPRSWYSRSTRFLG
jgi:hypothetical protein